MNEFWAVFKLRNFEKGPTYFKNVDEPTCIHHILKNHPMRFQHSGLYESGLSDFHKLTFTNLKLCYVKQKPSFIKYIDYDQLNTLTAMKS